MKQGFHGAGGGQYAQEPRNRAIVRRVRWNSYQLCAFIREDKRLKMGESGAWRCPYTVLPSNDTSLSHLHKTKGSTAASVGGFLFHGSFHVQTFLSTALPCWSRLHGSPRSSIEEFRLPLSDVPPLLNTLLLHRSKASGEFIKRNYSEKRKTRRGSRCRRCSSEQIRWLSDIGREDKQRQSGHNEREIRGENSGLWKKEEKKKGLDIGVHFVQFAIEFGNVELLQRWTEMIWLHGTWYLHIGPKKPWNDCRLLPLKFHLSSHRPSHVPSSGALDDEGWWMRFDSNNNSRPVKVEADWHWKTKKPRLE